eukprot:GILK01009313.1.p1 GENE.GILK01009313.1~~GILK01009313.1.p1  ORF type:complete len:333 (-),score=26.71 GILK01009313.1:51-1016(-)
MPKCGCDGVLCCLGCLSLIPGLRNKLISKLAFFPPTPKGYKISTKIINDSPKLSVVLLDDNGREKPVPDHQGVDFDAIWLKTSRGNTIPAFHFQHPRSSFTLVYSHGNSTDLGLMRDYFYDLSLQLELNVFAYEYSGYGCSSGRPSEANLYADIRAAISYLTDKCDVPLDRIILYGQSLGSAPSVDVAASMPVAGVVLHSAMTSGLRLIRKITKSFWFDVFENIKKMPRVRSPVFVIHGTHDQEIPFEHGVSLYSACSSAVDPWWVKYAGHNNIENLYRELYLEKLKDFLQQLSRSKEPTQRSSSKRMDICKEPLLTIQME